MCNLCEQQKPGQIKKTNPLHANRKKIWEIGGRFHCSVVGTCLSLRELRKLSRKAGVIFDIPVTDYQLHVGFVNLVGEKGYVARQVQKHLDRKYSTVIRQVQQATDYKEQQAVWQQALKEGDIAGAFWALVSASHISITLLENIYGEVHMLSHLEGASIRVDMQLLRKLKLRKTELDAEIRQNRNNYQKRLQEKSQNVVRLESRIAELIQESRESKVKLADFGSQHESTHDQSRQIHGLQGRIESLEEGLRTTEQDKQSALLIVKALQGKLYELQNQNQVLESIVKDDLEPACNDCSHQSLCDSRPDLKGKCVLYVGGRSRQAAHFRALVEKHNGEFIYHDGGQEDGRLQLGKTLSKADVVVCPLDCVSHDAVNRVKKYCTSQEKRLMLMPRSSLSAFADGIQKICEPTKDTVIHT